MFDLDGLVRQMEEDGMAAVGFSRLDGRLPSSLVHLPYGITLVFALSSPIVAPVADGPTYPYFQHYRAANAFFRLLDAAGGGAAGTDWLSSDAHRRLPVHPAARGIPGPLSPQDRSGGGGAGVDRQVRLAYYPSVGAPGAACHRADRLSPSGNRAARLSRLRGLHRLPGLLPGRGYCGSFLPSRHGPGVLLRPGQVLETHENLPAHRPRCGMRHLHGQLPGGEAVKTGRF